MSMLLVCWVQVGPFHKLIASWSQTGERIKRRQNCSVFPVFQFCIWKLGPAAGALVIGSEEGPVNIFLIETVSIQNRVHCETLSIINSIDSNCPIFPFNFTKDLGKVRGALGPRAQRRVCEFLKHSISPQCSSTYNVILYPRSFRIFQIYSSDKMDWFMYVYLLNFTYAYSFLLLFLLRDSKSRADLQFN